MHKLKLQERAYSIAYLVIGGVALLGTIALLLVEFFRPEPEDGTKIYLVIAIFVGIVAFSFLLCGFMLLGRALAIKRNIENPNTLCHQTYGKAGNFTYFRAILNYQEGNSGENAAINALGVASFVFLGVGFFRTGRGQRYIDVFVSDHDIILNERSRNPNLYDRGFMGISMQSIATILYYPMEKTERVEIRLTDYQRLTLDISVANETERATVYRTFQSLTELPV